MPETVSPGEVAHTLSHHHGTSAGAKHAERIEIVEAILLAIVAVATAWSGYQTARWDGDQAHLYGLSNKARAEENRAATLNGQQLLFNTSTLGVLAAGEGGRRREVRAPLRAALPAGVSGRLQRLDQDRSAQQPARAGGPEPHAAVPQRSGRASRQGG